MFLFIMTVGKTWDTVILIPVGYYVDTRERSVLLRTASNVISNIQVLVNGGPGHIQEIRKAKVHEGSAILPLYELYLNFGSHTYTSRIVFVSFSFYLGPGMKFQPCACKYLVYMVSNVRNLMPSSCSDSYSCPMKLESLFEVQEYPSFLHNFARCELCARTPS